MRFTRLAAATALVAATHAFLLPPTTTEADKDIVATLAFEKGFDVSSHHVKLECPGCPVILSGLGGVLNLVQVENHLQFNISVPLGSHQLFVNDVQIYPTTLSPPSIHGHHGQITADQFVKSSAGTWEYAASPRLGYSLAMTHLASSKELGLVIIQIKVLEVGDKAVQGVPSITLDLLETPSGKLMIGNVEMLSTSTETSTPTQSNKECATITCKWRAIITEKLSKIKGIKGCTGHGRTGAHEKHGPGDRSYNHGGPRPHGPHHAHKNHHRHGQFSRIFRSIVLHVILPIIVGVVGGVTAGIIGMVVGRLIVFLWRVTFRGGQHGPYHQAQQEDISGISQGSKSSLEHQGPPPTYEEDSARKGAATSEKGSELPESK